VYTARIVHSPYTDVYTAVYLAVYIHHREDSHVDGRVLLGVQGRILGGVMVVYTVVYTCTRPIHGRGHGPYTAVNTTSVHDRVDGHVQAVYPAV